MVYYIQAPKYILLSKTTSRAKSILGNGEKENQKVILNFKCSLFKFQNVVLILNISHFKILSVILPKGLRKVTIYLLTSCNTKERIVQNIYIHNSIRNIKN